jgi:hypothetical protein
MIDNYSRRAVYLALGLVCFACAIVLFIMLVMGG